MAAIMLRDPEDVATRERVKTIVEKLANDPNNGIEAVIAHDQLAAYGGVSAAAFVITLKTGYSTGAALSGPPVVDTPGKGTHG